MKLSKHSKRRIAERANVIGGQKEFFKNALLKGKAPGNLKDGAVKDYLLSKENRKCRVKLYRDYVFIYSKNNKQLYTMYKLPQHLIK